MRRRPEIWCRGAGLIWGPHQPMEAKSPGSRANRSGHGTAGSPRAAQAPCSPPATCPRRPPEVFSSSPNTIAGSRGRAFRRGDRWAGARTCLLSGTGQWASQTVPQAPARQDLDSRLLFTDARGRVQLSERDQIDALFSGSHIRLSDWGVPAGLEALAGRRMSPPLTNAAGFAGLREADRFDSVRAGWTRQTFLVRTARCARGPLRLLFRSFRHHAHRRGGHRAAAGQPGHAHASRLAGRVPAGRVLAGRPASPSLNRWKLGHQQRAQSMASAIRREPDHGGQRSRLCRGAEYSARQPRADPERLRLYAG